MQPCAWRSVAPRPCKATTARATGQTGDSVRVLEDGAHLEQFGVIMRTGYGSRGHRRAVGPMAHDQATGGQLPRFRGEWIPSTGEIPCDRGTNLETMGVSERPSPEPTT